MSEAPDGARWALFFDFDGTLVEIAPTPDAVAASRRMPTLLRGMRDRVGGALAVVTGRAVAEIDRYLPGLTLDVCGLHGLERRVDGRLDRPDFPDLSAEVAALRACLSGHPGVIVEDKRIGVAVHWRLAPEAEAVAEGALTELAGRLGPGYRVQAGKAVRELVPGTAHKGDAIRDLMGRVPYAGRRPLFVGDDRTDEHGFQAVEEMGGVGIKVGPGATVASRRLDDPATLERRMELWLAQGIGLLDIPRS